MKTQRTLAVGQQQLVLETGQLAKQADGSAVVRAGDTVVLATACSQKSPLPRDFLPLTVDYREYTYAAGKIPGGFFKREGRPTEKEIITSRLIDRPLRPLFPPGYSDETQVIALVLSADGEHDPDLLAINGASAALALSEIPYYNPVGAIRVGWIDGQMVFNPTNSQRDISDLDLVVVGTRDAVVMVEAGANQLPEEIVLECIWAGHREAQKLIDAQIEMFHALKLSKPTWIPPQPYPPELYERVRAEVRPLLESALFTKGKFERKRAVSEVQAHYLQGLPEDDSALRGQVVKIFEILEEEILYDSILESGRRFDGRKLDEIRPIEIEVGLLPRTHGSALFTRGETQALASVTLGTERDAQILEEYEGETRQKFILHYNFPPFSVGEVKFLRSPGRREIGHGVLARRALTPLLPHEEDFAYTIRIVSDILESNGSSSMATVCGGSLALFDAGVPMLAPVAGVAMGLVKRNDRFAVLTDIAGQEDHFGDMDFKVAGTRTGITALQMDLKLTGVTREIMAAALEQARRGRLQILDLMEEAIPAPRKELSAFAPRLYTMKISRDKIRDVIGPGGKTIRSILEETGCEIEVGNDGRVVIASPDRGAAERAISMIERLTQVPEIGKVYRGIVRRIEPFGAFVEIFPGQDGLVHISELAPYRVRETRDVVSEGDEIEVKVIDIDDTGRVRLSRKAVIMESPDYDPSQYAAMDQPGPTGSRGGRGTRSGEGPPRGGRGGRDGSSRSHRDRR